MMQFRWMLVVLVLSVGKLSAQEAEVFVTSHELDGQVGTLKASVGLGKPIKIYSLLKKDIPVHHALGHVLKLDDLTKPRRLALKVTGKDDDELVVAIRDDSDCLWGTLGVIDFANRIVEVNGQMHLRIPEGTPIVNREAQVEFEKLKPGGRIQVFFSPDRSKIIEVRVGDHLPAVNPYTRAVTFHSGLLLEVDHAARSLKYASIGNRNQVHDLTYDKGTQVRAIFEGKKFPEIACEELAPHVSAMVIYEPDLKRVLQIDVQMPVLQGLVHKIEEKKERKIWMRPLESPEIVVGPITIRESAKVVLHSGHEAAWRHIEKKDHIMLALSPDQNEALHIKKVSADKPIQIKVLADDWGGAPPSNIQAVCVSVANELRAFIPRRTFEPMVVSRSKGPPIAIFGMTEKGERHVKLNVGGNLWAQLAYQFGHEQGHVLMNHRPAKNPNIWFEESMCEAVSIFAIQRMSKSWRKNPPYSNWKSYAAALEDYANDYRRKVDKIEEEKFSLWYEKNKEVLVKFDRAAFSVVAVNVLLPLLEKNPAHFESLNWINQWDAKRELTFAEYLADWHNRVPEVHKPFVADIAKAFGIPLEAR